MKEKTYVDDIDRSVYDIKDKENDAYKVKAGLTPEIVEKISKEKNDPAWMQQFRLQSLQIYNSLQVPNWGPDIEDLDMDNIVTYVRPKSKMSAKWSEVPKDIKDTFERLGIPQAEQKSLAGVGAQYDSELVYHNVRAEVAAQGVVYTDLESAMHGEYAEMIRTHFMHLVKPQEHKFAALHGAVWSGGSFVYVPKGVSVTIPLQSYFRLNAPGAGQFEHTLIIVDEGASVDYVEGCTAPNYSSDSLHAAVVEVNVARDAYCRYTTIQNWSDNVYSLETKRAAAMDHATMEWVDGNLGSKVTMKYPSVYLDGEGAKGTMLSIAVASNGIHQDSGARMIHNAKNTSSSIVSKSIARTGGSTDYRGTVRFTKNAEGSKAHVECDTIIMDDQSKSDTIPYNEINCSNVAMEHEAKVSKISEEQLYYLMSRGISEEKATEMIIMGFVEPFTKQLPMEYAVELNRLISFEMEGSIG